MKFKDSFHPYAMVTILFWSLAYVLTRLALEHFSAFSLGFLRYALASLVLIGIAVCTKMKLPHKKDIPRFLLAGCLGFFLYMIAFNQGQAQVTSSTASIVIASVPVLTALLARFVYGEKLRVFQWVAIGVEFIGVGILTLMNGTFSLNSGLFWLFIAALALCLYNLLQRKLIQTYSALQATAYSILCGTCMLAIFSPTAGKEIVTAPPEQFLYLAILGICSSVVAYIAWAKAFAKAKKTSQVSNYMFVTPFLASLFGFLFAREIPDRATLMGGAVILVGVLIFNFGGAIFQKEK